MLNKTLQWTAVCGALMACAGTCLAQTTDPKSPDAQDKQPQIDPKPSDGNAQPEAAPEAAKDETGYQIFRDAAAALSKVNALTCTVKVYGTGSLESMSQSTTAEVSMRRDDAGVLIMRAKGSGTLRGKAEEQFDIGWRRETTEFLDHEAKKVIERRPREARGSGYQIGNGSRVEDWVSATPFTKVLSSSEIKVEDRQSFDGVDCEVLLATAGGKKTKTRWFLGAEDLLPRKIERIIDGEKFAGTMVVEITNVRAHESADAVAEESLRVQVPQGYTSDRYQPPSAQSQAVPDDNGTVSDAEKAKIKEQRFGDLSGGANKSEKDPAADAIEGKPSEEPSAKPGADEGSGTVDDPKVTPAPTPAPIAIPAAPTVLPAFELTTPAGVKVNNETLQGSVAVIDFFGSWNMGSKSWQPLLAEALKSKPELKVYAASIRERSADAPDKALKDRNVTWTHLLKGEELAKALGIKVFPATVIVGPSGNVIEIVQNCRGEDSIAKVTEAIDRAKN